MHGQKNIKSKTLFIYNIYVAAPWASQPEAAPPLATPIDYTPGLNSI